MQFSELGLSAPLLKAVSALGFASPSPIQSQAFRSFCPVKMYWLPRKPVQVKQQALLCR